MKKLVLFYIAILFLSLTLVGCTQKSNPENTTNNTTNQNTNFKENQLEKTPDKPSNVTKDLSIEDNESLEEKEITEPIKLVEHYYVDNNNFKLYRVNNVSLSNDTEEKKKIALLTFDDAPRNKDAIYSILDTLDKYNAKSIWFFNGYNLMNSNGEIIEEGATILLEIKNRGHIIANHSFQHLNLKTLNEDEMKKEIKKVSDIIETITGEKPKYFRHPFGAYSEQSIAYVEELGMQHMNWSVGSLDWEFKNPEKIKEQIISTMHNGANILMHDVPQTAEALDSVLDYLVKDNYIFVIPTEQRFIND